MDVLSLLQPAAADTTALAGAADDLRAAVALAGAGIIGDYSRELSLRIRTLDWSERPVQ